MAVVDLGEMCEYLSLSTQITNDELQTRVQNFLNQHQDTTTTWLDAFETTASQEARNFRQLEIVKELILSKMGRGNNTNGRILELDIAASSGNLKKVKDLCDNNLGMLHQPNQSLALPVVRASNAGHGDVTCYLYEITPFNVLMLRDGYWATCLLLDAIFYGFLDIALEMLEEVQAVQPNQVASLAVTKHALHRSTPLRFLALKPDLFRSHSHLGFWQRLFYSCLIWKILPKCFGIKKISELKDKHSKAQILLQRICEKTSVMVRNDMWKESVYQALFEAVENGNKEFFMEIIKYNPSLLWILEANTGRNLFLLAVKYKKEKIFNLIHGLGDRKFTLLRSYDNANNNILHMAALISPSDQLSKVSGGALKMQRDAQWFRVVTNLVSEHEVVQRNNEGKTPRQVFEESHETLRKEGEEWMKYTATACSFVAALIATVTFQAIFTLPGGNDQTSGSPLLLHDFHFNMFLISDALAFISSCMSVLIFLTILTSRYSFDDFIVSLPRKMIWGLTILFFSIASMLWAFMTSLSASMHQNPSLVLPLDPLATIPFIIFLMLEYTLLKEMISSTFGKGLFRRDTKDWSINDTLRL